MHYCFAAGDQKELVSGADWMPLPNKMNTTLALFPLRDCGWCGAHLFALRPGGVHGGPHLLGQHLAQLHAPLVEAVDAPDEALGRHAVLVQGQQLHRPPSPLRTAGDPRDKPREREPKTGTTSALTSTSKRERSVVGTGARHAGRRTGLLTCPTVYGVRFGSRMLREGRLPVNFCSKEGAVSSRSIVRCPSKT
jgi:hypothetical protein